MDSTRPRSSRSTASNTCNCLGTTRVRPALARRARCAASTNSSPSCRNVPGRPHRSPDGTNTTDSRPAGGTVSTAVSTATEGRENHMNTTPTDASSIVLDRAVGALLATAAGDALGAGYEFTYPSPSTPIEMIGGGIGAFEPGEWTDDTAMAVAVARVTAAGLDVRTPAGLDAVATGFVGWYDSRPKDIGNQTRAVLSRRDLVGADMQATARSLAGRKGGNGSLMRTAPIGIAYLGDEQAVGNHPRRRVRTRAPAGGLGAGSAGRTRHRHHRRHRRRTARCAVGGFRRAGPVAEDAARLAGSASPGPPRAGRIDRPRWRARWSGLADRGCR